LKGRSSTFYFSKDTFDSIPISTAFGLKSEPCSVQCSVEVVRAITQKRGVFDIAFLLSFFEESFS
jgi:hypothetical protein